ncbi:transcription factor Ouib isoform X1 [Drosophila tropicalis]|uniref:transcription factor Ouib isoform X1 n=1 Tax=Drosophila tropicalis TaxID=46794 RepID=UPI0035ABF99E
MLTKECRVCGRSNICSRALYLFDSGNRKHLRYVHMLTGLRLRNRIDLPVMMCYCCQSDIKTFMTFRRQCLRNAKRWNPQVKNEETSQSETEDKKTEPLVEEKSIAPVDPTMNCRRILPKRKSRGKLVVREDNGTDLNSDEDWEPLQPVQVIVEQDKQSVCEEHQEKEERDQLALTDDEETEDPNAKVKFEESDEENAIEPKVESSSWEEEEEQKDDKRMDRMRQPKIQEYKCEICGVVKNNKSSLVRHHYTHTGERPHPCKECPKAFLSGNELRAHILTQHTKEPPFPCRYCDRRYFSAIGRQKHERVHTNERPFVCDQCGKAFTRVCIMRQHMLTHTGMRRFKCDICDRSFTLKKHLSTHYISNTHKRNAEKAEAEKNPSEKTEMEFLTIERNNIEGI